VAPLKARTRRRLRFVAGSVAYFAVIWLLWPTPVVYPLKVFVVLLHEVSHGLAAVATGGTIERIGLTPDQGGVTWTRGGNPFVILSAGYLGSLAWGLAMLIASEGRPARLRAALAALGFLVLGLSILFVRGWFALPFALTAGALLLLSARRLRPEWQRGVLIVLGMTSALYALLDIRDDVIDRPHLESDAHMLAQMTGVPTVVWGLLWSVVGLLACWLVLRRRFRRA
jgi:hypothetical protein